MSDVLDLLVEARNLYAAKPSHAKISQSVEIDHHCMITAVDYAAEDLGNDNWVENCDEVFDVLADSIDASGIVALADYNAKHTTEEVLAVFDKAIESVRAN